MLDQINKITLPTDDEMNEMTIEQLIEWRDKLHPFYYERAKILDTVGFKAWQKSLKWLSFYMMVENIQKGLPRWERIANYPK